MAAPALLWLLLSVGTMPGAAGRGGAGPATAGSPQAYQQLRRVVLPPDTAKARPAAPDSTKAAPPAPVGLTPDAEAEEDKLTRKSAIFIGAAMALLTLTTLLLYNVRSR